MGRDIEDRINDVVTDVEHSLNSLINDIKEIKTELDAFATLATEALGIDETRRVAEERIEELEAEVRELEAK